MGGATTGATAAAAAAILLLDGLGGAARRPAPRAAPAAVGVALLLDLVLFADLSGPVQYLAGRGALRRT